MDARNHDGNSEERLDEKQWKRNPVWSWVWGLSLVWAGIVLLLENLGVLAWWLGALQTRLGVRAPGSYDEISFILLGMGVIFFGGFVARLFIPNQSHSPLTMGILALVFVSIGLGSLFSWEIFLPLLLIMLGIWMIIRSRQRQEGR